MANMVLRFSDRCHCLFYDLTLLLKKKMKKILSFISLTIVTVNYTLAQCPMCKASVESNMEDGGEKVFGMGLNSGILYLMAIPYIMVIAIGFFWYRAKKRQERNAPRYT